MRPMFARAARVVHRAPLLSSRISQTAPLHASSATGEADDIEELLATPSWSVASLLPNAEDLSGSQEVSSKQLHHLLRLSALPPPKDSVEEEQMLKTLASQLHFVKKIQSVDTTGVEPLYSIRDESKAGREQATLGLSELQEALAKEEVVGKYHKRLRRKHEPSARQPNEEWDVLGTAETKVGRYFVVEGGKD